LPREKGEQVNMCISLSILDVIWVSLIYLHCYEVSYAIVRASILLKIIQGKALLLFDVKLSKLKVFVSRTWLQHILVLHLPGTSSSVSTRFLLIVFTESLLQSGGCKSGGCKSGGCKSGGCKSGGLIRGDMG
jgi:uncharacterized membrane protein YgcG